MSSPERHLVIGPVWANAPVVPPVVMDDAVFEFAHMVASHAVYL